VGKGDGRKDKFKGEIKFPGVQKNIII